MFIILVHNITSSLVSLLQVLVDVGSQEKAPWLFPKDMKEI